MSQISKDDFVYCTHGCPSYNGGTIREGTVMAFMSYTNIGALLRGDSGIHYTKVDIDQHFRKATENEALMHSLK